MKTSPDKSSRPNKRSKQNAMPAPSKAVSALYKPTPEEHKAAMAYYARKGRRRPAPDMKVTKQSGGALSVEIDHPAAVVVVPVLMEALGIADHSFFEGLLNQLTNVGSSGTEVDEKGLNFMLSMVRGVEPNDQVEAMLAAQMAAVHNATMTFARRLAHVENIPQQDSAERALNKLARTFTTQMDALKRYRSKGEQKVIVEHVTVNDGGQAVVGNVITGGRGQSEKDGTTP